MHTTLGPTRTVSLSPRMARLRQRIMRRRGSFVESFNPYCRDVALWRAMAGRRSVVQVRAATLRELVSLAPIDIQSDWTLAGEHLVRDQGCGFRLTGDKLPDDTLRLAELGVEHDKLSEIRDAVRKWANRAQMPSDFGAPSADDLKGGCEWGDFGGAFLGWGWMENHSVRDLAKVMRIGFGGIRKEIEAKLASAEIASPDYPRAENFWRAALDVCDAGILLGERYAALAQQQAERASDAEDRHRLLHMAETCRRVPKGGARTFHEAVQALWLAHILTCGEDGINANSIGRLDQILFPFYEPDARAGRVTRDDAVELMAELACKLYLEYEVQAIVLAGQDSAGRDTTNDLTSIILDATEAVDFVRDLSVRLHRNSPPALVHRAAELIVRGGIPFVFNDDCFVKALADRGIALEDARDYAPIGCIELTIPGKANPHAVSGWFNAAKCVELAMFDGREPRKNEQWGPRTGMLSDHRDFESFYRAYTQQVECMARRMAYRINRGEIDQREHGPLPCWSVMTDQCIERGRDITDGGALYNYHSIAFMGAANVADSMIALKRLVFEDKRVSPDDLLDAIRANFEGHEPIRQLLLNSAPKYGNDAEEVDAIAGRVCRDFIRLMDTMKSPLGGPYFVHLFTWRLNVNFGKGTGATPDGRRAGEPLAYSLSANQGRDEKGVTAMLRSLSKLPHESAAGASAAIIDLDPAMVSGPGGADLVARLITGAIDMGVGQIQFNVVSAERLRKAQADPERYGNIAVRVAGYSQMFRLIEPDVQEHIIARTKHKA